MKKVYLLFISYFLLFSQFLPAEVMNGISYKKYKDFEKKWKLITVRYRKDNNEIRMVYANPVAAKAFEKGIKPFPDGSILAKVAYLAQPDPAFESSLGPSHSRRYQFMVKDKKKYKAHRGWGYALFNSYGQVNPEPVENQINACASCHDVVPERDYVFSWHVNHVPAEQLNLFKLKYRPLDRESLGSEISSHLPEKFKDVLMIEGTLTKEVFQGTLDELKPALARIAVTEKRPVLFRSDDKKKFTLIFPEDLKLECDDEGAKGLFLVSINSLLEGRTNKVHFCQSYYK